MSAVTQATTKDLNVLYDIMIESSTRLVATLYASMSPAVSETDAQILAAVIAVRDRADAVDEDDAAAIVAATEQFRAEREQLEG